MSVETGTDSNVDAAKERPFDAATWVEEHGDVLFRYALGRVGRHDLAEDLVQETFLAGLASVKSFEGRSTGRTWLVAILRRKIADHRRREKGPTIESAPVRAFDAEGRWVEPPSPWRSTRDLVEDGEFREAVDGCLARLPRHLAEPFLLRACEELAPEEVRSILDLKPDNLRVRLHRARLLLRDCLERSWFREARS